MAAAIFSANGFLLEKPSFYIEISGKYNVNENLFIIFSLIPADQSTLGKEGIISLYLR